MVGAHALAVSEPQGVRVLEHGAALDDGDAGLVQGRRVGGLQAGNLLVLVGDQGRPVETRAVRRPAEPRSLLEVEREARRIDEKLFRHATADDAGAADPVFLRDHDARTVAGGDARSAHAARSRADHEQIDISHHDLAWRWPPPCASQVVTLLLHLGTEAHQNFLRYLFRPRLSAVQALVDHGRLLGGEFLAQRRLVERGQLLQLGFAEALGIEPRDLVNDLVAARRELRPQLPRDLVEILEQPGIGRKEDILGALHHARDNRIEHVDGALGGEQVLGGRQRAGRHGRRRRCGRGRRARLLCGRRSGQPAERKGRYRGVADERGCNHGIPPGAINGFANQARSTVRTPSGPAMIAVWASPMNKPCSTTPGMAASRWASDAGSALRSSAASRIQWPPSVTKTWPSLVRRSSALPGAPAAEAAASTARRVAASPNGTTSMGSGNRPSTDTHFE